MRGVKIGTTPDTWGYSGIVNSPACAKHVHWGWGKQGDRGDGGKRGRRRGGGGIDLKKTILTKTRNELREIGRECPGMSITPFVKRLDATTFLYMYSESSHPSCLAILSHLSNPFVRLALSRIASN